MAGTLSAFGSMVGEGLAGGSLGTLLHATGYAPSSLLADGLGGPGLGTRFVACVPAAAIYAAVVSRAIDKRRAQSNGKRQPGRDEKGLNQLCDGAGKLGAGLGYFSGSVFGDVLHTYVMGHLGSVGSVFAYLCLFSSVMVYNQGFFRTDSKE